VQEEWPVCVLDSQYSRRSVLKRGSVCVLVTQYS